MKNSTLLFRSLAIIIFIAGAAHLVNLGLENTSESSEAEYYNGEDFPLTDDSQKMENTTDSISSNYNETTDYIVGSWKVTHKTEDFNGAILYHLKKEGNIFNAYSTAYMDTQGNKEQVTPKKILVINQFDGYKGTGSYNFTYEGAQYDVACQIDMIDENTFAMSYEFYDYGDVETWKRVLE